MSAKNGHLTLMTGERSGQALTMRVLSHPTVTIVHLGGVLEYATAPLLRAVLPDLLRDRSVLLDLADVSLLDGHAIGMLVAMRHTAAQDRGHSLWLRHVEGRVRRALEIAGADKLVDPDPDPDAFPAPTGQEAHATWQEAHANGMDPTDHTVETLLRARGRQPAASPLTGVLREQAIHHARPLAVTLAHRYQGRGEPSEDLVQVATLGLINAIDRYDPHQGAFTAYAVPTITGEIKRHFRDKGWQIHVPRRLQELRLRVAATAATLTQGLGRTPTVAELATQLGVSEREIREAQATSHAYRADSLSAPTQPWDTAGDGGTLADELGSPDSGFEGVDNRETLRLVLATLPTREQHILTLRFYDNLTQAQIAEQVGISQMHVSRLLARALTELRHRLLVE